MDDNLSRQEKLLKEYEQKAQATINRMSNVLIRAGRKKDDVAYRKILEKLQQETP